MLGLHTSVPEVEFDVSPRLCPCRNRSSETKAAAAGHLGYELNCLCQHYPCLLLQLSAPNSRSGSMLMLHCLCLSQYRWHAYKSVRDAIDQNEGGLAKFSQGYKYYGLNRGQKDGVEGIWYREWAPGARVSSSPTPPKQKHKHSRPSHTWPSRIPHMGAP